MAVPTSTPEQRAAALERAAAARRLRAETKELLKAGSIMFRDVIDDEDDFIATTKIGSILPALPGVGKVKAKRFLEEHKIASNRRLRSLTTRQRTVLLEHFG